jgi:hypothetical protein
MHANVVFAHDLIESLRSFLLIQKNQNFNPTTGGNQEPNMPVCRSFSVGMASARMPVHPCIWLGPTRRHGIKSCALNESIQHKIE